MVPLGVTRCLPSVSAALVRRAGKVGGWDCVASFTWATQSPVFAPVHAHYDDLCSTIAGTRRSTLQSMHHCLSPIPCCCCCYCCPQHQVAPSLLLVKDSGGAVFGAYVSDSWRYNPRFYGSGESFVFQVTHFVRHVSRGQGKCTQAAPKYQTIELSS
jgi:hypothetical protein